VPTERLIVEIDEKGALVVKRNIADIGKQSTQTNAAVGLLKKGLGALAVAKLGQEILQLSESFTRIQNTIRNTVSSQEELAVVTERLFAISQDTRQGFEETTQIYDRLAAASEDLHLSQEQTLKFLEQINRAVVVGGGDLARQGPAVEQFVQGLADGSLQGLELRNVLRQLPEVAKVLADELKTTPGHLRKLADQGKVSSDVVKRAFDSADERLKQGFGRTVPTISQAFTVFRNSLTRIVGEFNNASGSSQSFAQAVLLIARNLDKMVTPLLVVADLLGATVLQFKELFSTLGPGLEGAGTSFKELARDVVLFVAAIIRAGATVTDFLVQPLIAAFEALLTIGRTVGQQLRLFSQGKFKEAFALDDVLGETLKDIATGTAVDRPLTEFVDAIFDKVETAFVARSSAAKPKLTKTVQDVLIPDVPIEDAIPKRGVGTGTNLIDVEEVKDPIDEVNAAMQRSFEEIQKQGTLTGDVLEAAFGGAFNAIDELIHGTSRSFTEFTASILADIASISAKFLLIQGLQSLFPGSANLERLFGAQHGGSFVVGGQGGPDSQVVAFRASPGERIDATPPGQSPSGSAGAAPQVNTKVLVNFDPRSMLDALTTGAGDRVLMHFVQRNPTQIRKALGG
jgi:tape measure domain-containing protein